MPPEAGGESRLNRDRRHGVPFPENIQRWYDIGIYELSPREREPACPSQLLLCWRRNAAPLDTKTQRDWPALKQRASPIVPAFRPTKERASPTNE